MKVCLRHVVCVCVCGHLVLCDPGHGILEAPSRLLPGSSAPPGAPPPLYGACDGLVDPLQLVFAHLHPADSGREKGHLARFISDD